MNSCVFRPARLDDASAIAELFRKSYASATDSDIAYPYPQLLSPPGVRALMSRANVLWRVAEGPQGVVGSFGSVFSCQPPFVNVAEPFGLVVDARARRQGVGARLFQEILEALKATGARVILSDTRTREAGGIAIVRAAGFEPVGFVPWGHRTPGGMEAMLYCAWVLPKKDAPRRDEIVLPPRALALRRCFEANRSFAFSGEPGLVSLPLPTPVEPHEMIPPSIIRVRGMESVEATVSLIQTMQGRSGFSQPLVHLIGIGGLAKAADRFVEVAFVATARGNNVGGLVASFDCLDGRIRVLEAASLGTSVTTALLSKIEEWRDSRGMSGVHPPTLVLDVRADEVTLLTELERRGYIPTTLHPRLLMETHADGPKCIDVFRYELLASVPSAIPDSVRVWPEACAIAKCVIETCQDLSLASTIDAAHESDRE